MAINDEEINQTEIGELKALLAQQQQRLEMLEERQAAPSSSNGAAKEQRATRRQMIKLAGAALMGAAGTAALNAIPAQAVQGSAMTVGTIQTQDQSNTTGISLFGGAPGRVFEISTTFGNPAPNLTAIFGMSYARTSGGVGVLGYTGGTQATRAGVMGYSKAASTLSIGVLGSAFPSPGAPLSYPGNGTGVVAYSHGGDGLHSTTVGQNRRALYAYTSATGSVGMSSYSQFSDAVRAGSNSGNGVVAYGGGNGSAFFGISFSKTGAAGLGVGAPFGGPDAKLGGSGRLVQAANISGGVGAPNYTPSRFLSFTSHGYFESVRADDGGLWISGPTGVGRASWRRVNAVRVDSADGTGAPYAPFRLYDSRSGAKKAAGSTTVVVAAGQGALASAIPADAIAIIGNLTATQYTGGGFLTISPAGVPAATSTVNFITGQSAIANSFIVGLGTGVNAGKVQVKVAGHASHILIDVTGYIQ